MASAAQVRELLAALPEISALRVASSLAPPCAAVPTGLTEIDALLGGGLPRGRVTELLGPASAGRTGLALAAAAAATQRGEVIAWVDLEDALDPPSLAAADADLSRVLWVRPPSVLEGLKAADAILGAGGFGLVVIDFGDGPNGRGRPMTRSRGPHRAAGSPAVWTRLSHRAERGGTTLLVSAVTEVAGTHATVALAFDRKQAVIRGCPALLESIESRVRLARCRFAPPGADVLLPLAAI